MTTENVRPEYDAETVARFERVAAETLRFGDLMPFFGLHVRSVTLDGHKVIVNFVKQVGIARERVTFLLGDQVTALRAGADRG